MSKDNDIMTDEERELLEAFEDMLDEKEQAKSDWNMDFEDPHGDVEPLHFKVGDLVKYKMEDLSYHGDLFDSSKPFEVEKLNKEYGVLLRQNGYLLFIFKYQFHLIEKFKSGCDCGAKHTRNHNLHTDYCSAKK